VTSKTRVLSQMGLARQLYLGVNLALER